MIADQETCLISTTHSVCFCTMYHVGRDYVGVVPDAPVNTYSFESGRCDKVQGFAPQEWANFKIYQMSIQAYLERKHIR
jgi:hypothetical protein